MEVLTGRRLFYHAVSPRQTVLMDVSANDFAALLESSSELERRWNDLLALRFVTANQRIFSLLAEDLTTRITRILLDESVEQEGLDK